MISFNDFVCLQIYSSEYLLCIYFVFSLVFCPYLSTRLSSVVLLVLFFLFMKLISLDFQLIISYVCFLYSYGVRTQFLLNICSVILIKQSISWNSPFFFFFSFFCYFFRCISHVVNKTGKSKSSVGGNLSKELFPVLRWT